MKELIFEVTDELDGSLSATALGFGIHTQADSVEELKKMVREAVDCYFEEDSSKAKPSVIRLHFVRDELLAV